MDETDKGRINNGKSINKIKWESKPCYCRLNNFGLASP